MSGNDPVNGPDFNWFDPVSGSNLSRSDSTATDGALLVHGTNRNLLVDGSAVDPLSQQPAMNSTYVAVEKIGPIDTRS